ncbi:hypothetical protein PFHG_05079 [Plasmodium falciparum HB3]|uniref:Erythrocyte membrane protein 1, PfEMP1 n=2 Tax=Plasmodium falciparum TaxID=5833 RepID=A0A0L7KLD0_PLAFX|nr:hypothetical protein PFHG_05079 [Plasmodium falciparum HB3]
MKNGNIDKCNGIPIEDYIPQRLRWMTEWAEWFCKMQSQQYDKLEEECGICMNGTCKDVLGKGCVDCKKQCQEYEKNIKEWADQWTIMDMKYRTLYLQAQITARNPGDTSFDNPNDQYVIKFLQKLQEATGDTTRATTSTTITPYSTAAGYIHQEIGYGGCQVQTQFCEKENGDTSSTATNNGKYAFKHPPTDYKDKCECKENEAQPKKVETPKHNVEVCSIVEQALKTSLTDACTLKYGSKSHVGWKCVTPSGEKSGGSEPTGTESERLTRQRREAGVPTTTSSGPTSGKSGDTTGGSICIPPRRRRLYIGGLTKLTSDETQSQSLETSGGQKTPSGKESSQSDKLRTAFIQSAAIETFFLWHKYKMDKAREDIEKRQGENGLVVITSSKPDDLDNELKSGDIPEEFKRQMFYTLADYKDILYSGSNDEKNGYNDIFSGDKEIKEREEKIKEKITNFFQNGDSQPPSDEKRKDWWDKNASHIWKGMICALTYKDSGTKETPPKQIDEVQKAFFGDNNNRNPPLPVKPGTYQSTYDYTNVSFSGGFNSDKNAATITTKLENFVKRPTYFRWLEEWGEEFCRKQKHKLDIIKKDCYKDGKKDCSGDGLRCDEEVPENKKIYEGFHCPSCANSCGLYKRWIGRKKDEFTQQSNAYKEQQGKCQTESDNGFCGTLQKFTTAGDFLQKLKKGPCKTNNDTEKVNEEGKKFFDKNGDTFKHAKDCAPCSQFTVDCKNCNGGGGTKGKCNGRNTGTTTITASDIENAGNSAEDIGMVVSDDNTNGNKFEHLQDCTDANIFKGFRKDVWKCGEYCGVDICTLEKKDTNGEVKEHIIVKELLKRWLEYFLEDYNRIRKKIKPCIENGKGSTCIRSCVDEWIKKKKEEWDKINDTYIQEYTRNNNVTSNDLNSFLEPLISQIPVVNDKGEHSSLQKLEKSLGCKCAKSSEEKVVKQDKNSDIVDCMLDKLQIKIEKCKKIYHENGDNKCTETSQQTLDLNVETLDDDIETEEAKKMMPTFCNIDEPKEPVVEEKCEASTGKPEGGSDGEKEEEKPKGVEEEEKVPPPPATDTRPAPPSPPLPLPSDEPFNRDILEKTIPFGIAFALGSIAFLFLKKKTKSTIDLLRVINIPKSDYDIPTKLSPNRYIPYTSGKYRGKRYIYLEGDSGTDSGYTDHYSDITSSSESEYEELDINDIYAPRAPKYKTLIEVVLEPSGNNTTASGNNTTASDTQNDIQNDGIPSSKITDNEWNTLKDEFISQYLQSEQPNDVPNDYSSGDIPMNTQPNTLYFNKPEEKPFIMSIHDRDLYTGEEYNYNVNMSTNSMDDPKYVSNNVYSGIDLINDSLSGEPINIYDEVLKRKENELFGTNNPKRTSTYSVAKNTNSDPLHNQLELFHTWLDRHRDMCEKWENQHERLAKLKEEWENETHSGNKHSDIPSGKLSDIPSDNNIHSDIHPSDIPSGKQSDIPSDNNIPSSNQILNTDVSIQIHMDNPKPINQFTNMDTILEDLEKYNEPYYDVQDDIYYDVNDDNDISTVNPNNMEKPSKVKIELDVNKKTIKEKYPIADVWDI